MSPMIVTENGKLFMVTEVRFERNAIPDSTAEALRAMGHTIKFGGVQGDGHTIIVRDGVAYGANEHRSADSKVGVS